MGTEHSLKTKRAYMKLLFKRKDLPTKDAILDEFCIAMVCSRAIARENYNLLR